MLFHAGFRFSEIEYNVFQVLENILKEFREWTAVDANKEVGSIFHLDLTYIHCISYHMLIEFSKFFVLLISHSKFAERTICS